MIEIAFIRPRNITSNRNDFFSGKQKKGEMVEQFYSNLKELAENCDFESREEVIIRDIFVTNMLDDDIQPELLRDTVDPDGALRIAVNMGWDIKTNKDYFPTITTMQMATQSMQ